MAVENAYWFLFFGDEMVLRATEGGTDIPFASDIDRLHIDKEKAQMIGMLHGSKCCALNVPSDNAPAGFYFQKVRQLYQSIADDRLELAFRAFHIMTWIKNNKHCGRCGEIMQVVAQELVVQCRGCGHLVYPRISPAIIVAVTRGNQILLARSSRFPAGRYSVIAGFVEPGETLEECVRRELQEEVGIAVTTIRYFGNQPWPFPDSLMIAFTAECSEGQITIDNNEIVDANWFTVDQLPDLPPMDSIARRLIEWFVEKNDLHRNG